MKHKTMTIDAIVNTTIVCGTIAVWIAACVLVTSLVSRGIPRTYHSVPDAQATHYTIEQQQGPYPA